MASKRKEALAALTGVVETAMASTVRIAGWPAPPKIVTNGVMPERVPPEGLVMIRSGRRRTSPEEFGSGRPVYGIVMPASIEVFLDDVLQRDRDEMLGRFEAEIGEGIASDPTLGGKVENTDIVEGETDDAGEEATDTLAAALISVEMTLYDENPLV
jgi:hypothetical protein